jgi:hypothetical protein
VSSWSEAATDFMFSTISATGGNICQQGIAIRESE